MPEEADALLQSFLDKAPPYEAPSNQRADSRTARTGAGSENPTASGDIAEGVAVLKFLSEKGVIDVAGYVDWNRSGIAFKNTYGDVGFDAWAALSASWDNYDGEERCREEWENIKVRPENAQRLTIATFIAQARESGWRPSRNRAPIEASGGDGGSSDDGGSGGRSGGGSSKIDPPALAVQLAEDAGDEFWLDLDGKPHVTYDAVTSDGGAVLRHVPVASESYRGVLKTRFHADVPNKALSRDHANLATELLGFRAAETGRRHKAAVRIGEHEGRIYVDQGGDDGAAIEIDEEGWRKVLSPPVRFVRGSRGKLPDPQPGGVLSDFNKHFNLTPDDLLRAIGFMIGTFTDSGSYCILFADGEQGAGKSGMCDKILNLVDPPLQFKGGRMAFNRKEQDLHIGVLGVHVAYFDNVSTFSAEAADTLCRLSTGGGSGARTLYTDTGYTEINVIRPVIVTSIGAPSARGDLLNRSLQITALPVSPSARRTERKLLSDFQADQPRLFGFLLTCVSAAIRNRKRVEAAVETGEIHLPRMADFAEFVEGAYEVLGLPLGGFSKLLEAGQKALQTEAVLGTPVGLGLTRYFSESGTAPLRASASDILRLLRSRLPPESKLPEPNMLGKALNRISGGLREWGIEWSSVAAEGHSNVKMYEIRSTQDFRPDHHLNVSSDNEGDDHF